MKQHLENRNVRAAGLLILIIIFFTASFFITSNPVTAGVVSYLDHKKATVMELSAASTAASAAISMIPGDAGTPVAEKMADLSMYTLLILCAIFLEKYLVTITGVAAMRFLIPGALLIYLAGMYFPHPKSKSIAKKLIILAIAVGAVIPVSVAISKQIESTYESSINETIENAKENAQEIQDNTQNETLWDKFISTIEGGVSTLTHRFEGMLNNFIEAIAVLIVTACLIPVLVLLFLVWLLKSLIPVSVPPMSLPLHQPHRE